MPVLPHFLITVFRQQRSTRKLLISLETTKRTRFYYNGVMVKVFKYILNPGRGGLFKYIKLKFGRDLLEKAPLPGFKI